MNMSTCHVSVIKATTLLRYSNKFCLSLPLMEFVSRKHAWWPEPHQRNKHTL